LTSGPTRTMTRAHTNETYDLVIIAPTSKQDSNRSSILKRERTEDDLQSNRRHPWPVHRSRSTRTSKIFH
jgi:hypothetical protein